MKIRVRENKKRIIVTSQIKSFLKEINFVPHREFIDALEDKVKALVSQAVENAKNVGQKSVTPAMLNIEFEASRSEVNVDDLDLLSSEDLKETAVI